MALDENTHGVAVVTGASRGIGAAIAERLAAEGLAVACAATSATNVAGVVERIRSECGVAALGLAIQVEDAESVESGLSRVEEQLGPISVMVNNAGVSGVAPFLEMPLAQFDRVIDINLRGVFICGQAAARRMVASGTSGSIVNIGSIAGVNGFPKRTGYAASKAAVHHMTKVMAIDLAAHGIRVNCVAPGYIRTDMVQDLIGSGALDENLLERRIPLSHLGTVDDVAAAVAWISSTEARYVTGATLLIDGGWAAYGHV
jgi:NAD(P)-dependent dehydrogenase (short-subunit alcohol dehydrogenase family)